MDAMHLSVPLITQRKAVAFYYKLIYMYRLWQRKGYPYKGSADWRALKSTTVLSSLLSCSSLLETAYTKSFF